MTPGVTRPPADGQPGSAPQIPGAHREAVKEIPGDGGDDSHSPVERLDVGRDRAPETAHCPDVLERSGPHILIGYAVSVWGAQDLDVAAHEVKLRYRGPLMAAQTTAILNCHEE